MKKWVALFSQTGGEIVDLASHFNRWPDIIITNNRNINSWCGALRDLHSKRIDCTYSNPKKQIKIIEPFEARTLNVLHNFADKDSLITLHGWLRIVPEDICNVYTIYNGHPGLITEYPELKGKDPQERMFFTNCNGYAYYGSVVHKVVPEVDSGEVVSEVKRVNTLKNLDEVFASLKSTSLEAWIDFLQTTDIIKKC